MSPTVSRRRLLQSLSLIGAAAAVGCSEVTTRSSRTPRSSNSSTTAVTTTTLLAAAGALGRERRLERATFGVTDALRAEVEVAGGFEGWLDAQLAGSFAPAPDATSLLATVEARLPAPIDVRVADKQARRELVRGSIETITGRIVLGAAYGPDQLRQRVVGVLADLLHVTSSSQRELTLICGYDQVLRVGAFGRFSDLLVASARHPAMLVFLDQATSRADGGRTPNENYAREVMELHTVGVDGGYDEIDVKELAHVLSGWSLNRRSGAFEFRDAWHDLGPLAEGGDVLGWRPSPGQSGEAAVVAVLEHLARHQATARRLALRFARAFVSESIDADDPLVSEAADVYLANDTAIGPMVRHLLTSERFDSTATLMLRRPIDMVAHMLRVTGAPAEVADLDVSLPALAGLMNVLGHVPYGWPAPNGFPTGSAAWSNAGAMLGRWNAVVTLADDEDQVALMCSPAHQLV